MIELNKRENKTNLFSKILYHKANILENILFFVIIECSFKLDHRTLQQF